VTIDLGELTSVLDETDTVYVAVRTKRGPHLTPELFTVSGGRILCLTSAVTLKAKRAKEDPVIGLCAWSPGAAVSVVGAVELIDPVSPTSVLRAPVAAATSPLGVARFLRDNAAEMAGAAIDAVTGKLGGPIPPRRVVLAITPIAGLVLTGSDVELAEGWDLDASTDLADATEDDADTEPLDLSALPGGLGDLAASGPAAVGWLRTDGSPLALPATWDAERSEATVPTAAFETCGAAASGPACVTFDTWTGYGPTGKQGVMLRGEGRAARDDGTTRLTFELDRASHWDGIETGTSDLS
jgi:hypothetical protein